jgi:2-dehydro-3-deoxygluconokinase
MGAKNVVLKLGSRGCMVSDGGRCTAVPALPVNAIDATGGRFT